MDLLKRRHSLPFIPLNVCVCVCVCVCVYMGEAQGSNYSKTRKIHDEINNRHPGLGPLPTLDE